MRAVVFEADGVLVTANGQASDVPGLDIVAGADELLPILRRLGVKLAVLATTDIAAQLEQSPLRGHLHAVVVSDARSIDPEKRGLTRALHELDALPEHTVVVSGRVLDIMTGKEGRVAKTIGISWGNSNPLALNAAGADHIIGDIPSLLDVLE